MIAAFIGVSPLQFALQAASSVPGGGTFTAGAGTISASGNILNINQSTLKGIIDWNTFSVGKGASAIFKNGSGATLNRVTGGIPTTILGQLAASGSIYILNPAGVLIGRGAMVHTGGDFLAATLSISNAAFLAGGNLLFGGPSAAVVVNLGNISSSGGSVYLVGHTVRNGGSINAPNGTAALAAGGQILLTDSSNNQRVFVQAPGGDVTNSGYINAAQAELKANGGNIYALAGNNGGQIRATGTATKDGRVWLVAQNGTADVSGLISARNANGEGGNIETSGAHVDANAATLLTGRGGNWLLDPDDLTIDSTLARTIANSLNGGTNVTEQTTAPVSGGNGDIFVGGNIAWNSSANLTLSAYRDVNVNTGTTISNTGAGSLTLRADNTSNGTGVVNVSGLVDFSGSTGHVAILYNPLGSAATKYTNGVTYNTGSTGTQVLTNSSWSAPADASVSSQATAYMLVNNITDLQNMSTNVGGTYGVGTDFDAGGVNFTPIATSQLFNGIVDGQGHTISNFRINGSWTSTGLISQLSGIVRNVNLVGESITASGSYVGGLVANALSGGTIANSTSAGTVTENTSGPGPAAGGLVGLLQSSGLVKNSSSSVTVSLRSSAGASAAAYAGGLIGSASNSTAVISQSYASGSVTLTATSPSLVRVYAGGLVGNLVGTVSSSYATGPVQISAALTAANGTYFPSGGGLVGNVNAGSIQNSYASGSVGGSAFIHTGGLMGWDRGFVSASYASGTVTSTTSGYSGGLAGYYSGNVPSASYWDTQTTGQSNFSANTSSLAGATGQSTATFKNGSLPSAFSSGTWTAANGFYPYLNWSAIPVSGTALNGASVLASAAVDVIANGQVLGAPVTDSSGFYSFFVPPSTSGVLTALAGAAVSANTFSDGDGAGGYTGMNLHAGTLLIGSRTNNTYSGMVSALNSAAGSVSPSLLLFSINAGAMTLANAASLSVQSQSALTLDQAISTSGTVTLAAQGAITQSQPVTAGGLTMSGTGSITLNQVNAVGTLAASTGGNLAFTNSTDLTIGSVAAAGTVSISSNTGTLTIPSGSTITANGSGTPLQLSAGNRFVNLEGSDALNIASGGGRWLVYSQNPANDTTGSLAANFKQYNATYGVTTPAQSTGDGLLYTLAPVITPTLTGTVSKIYDGSNTASVTAGNLSADGTAAGDTVTLSGSGTASYNSSNADTGMAVTETGVSLVSASSGMTPVYGYQLGSTTATGNIGSITPATLTATISADNKIYDRTTAATGGMTLHGFLGNDTSSVTGDSYAFSTANAGTGLTVTESGAALTNSNYQLGTVGTTTANITPATLTATITAIDKVYDRGTTATGNMTLHGLLGTETSAVTGDSYAFNTANAGTGLTVTESGATLTNSNYQLGTVGTTTANITPATLTATISADNKIYDRTATATGNMTLHGLLGNETSSVTGDSYAFNSANAHTGLTVTESGAALTNSNYQLGTVGVTTANITPATLTATISADNKIYDRTTTATGNMTLHGLLGNDTSSVTGDNYAFNTANAGTGLTVTEFGATLTNSNYQLGTVGTTTASITPATLTATITAIDKVYDRGTTAMGNMTLHGLLGNETSSVTGDSYAFSTADAGNGLTVTESGAALTNSNYQLGTVGTTTANITPATLTATISADNKIYDRTTTATGNMTLHGLLGTDTSAVTGDNYAFSTANAGTGLTVTESGAALTNSNYQLGTVGTTTANITPATLTATITAIDKVYDRGTTATGNMTLHGLLGTETSAVTGDSYAFNTANAGTGLTVTESGATLTNSNYQLGTVGTTTANITPATLTATISADNKIYDRTATATGNMTLHGLLGNETSSVTGDSYAFNSANVGTGLTVTESGAALTNSNYQLGTVGTTTANITPATLTATISADNKVYDRSASTTGTMTLHGLLGNETSSVTGDSYAFSGANVGNGLTVTESGAALTNSNYQLGTVGTTTANITPATLTATISADNKIYDRTATATGTLTLHGLLGNDSSAVTGDNYAFNSANAGTGLTVTESGATLTNSNYQLGTVGTTTANITPATLTATISADNKVYDRTATATGTLTLHGLLGNDSSAVTGDNYAFNSANAGTGLTVTESGAALTNSNYQLGTVGTTTANITPATLTATISADNKIYDRTTTATGGMTLHGLLGNDTSSVTGDNYAFNTANAGTGLTVTEFGATLTNSNYQLGTVGTTTANITPATLTATITAIDKVYDRGTTATGNMTLHGLLATDTSAVTGDSYAFSTANAGNSLTVTESGATLTNSNYQLGTVGVTTANIMPATLTATISADNKIYDRTTTATGNMTLHGLLGNETSSVTGDSYAFNTANVGTGLTVTESGAALTNSNYQLGTVGTTTANITPATLTATISADNKVYDRTSTATGNMTLHGLLGNETSSVTGDSYAFSTANAGNGLTVTESGAALTNSNYQLGTVGTTTANVTPATLTATVSADNKIYDRTTTATGGMTLHGLLGGDSSSVTGDRYVFSNPNVGTGLTVTESGAALTNGNYQLGTVGTITANITPATLTATITAIDKVYDRGTTATGSMTLHGLLGGDSSSVTGDRYAFSTPNAGGGLSVTESGAALTNGNYQLGTVGTTTANITPATLTATVSANNKIYDQTTTASGNMILHGLLGNDTTSVTGDTYVFNTANAGIGLTVTESGARLTNTNYQLASIASTTTANITPATLTYTAAPVSRPIGTANPSFTGSVTGFLTNQSLLSATTGTPLFATSATPSSNAGAYAINGSGLTANNGNYVFAQAPGNAAALTINPATITLVIANSTRLQDQTNSAFAATYTGPPLPGLDVSSLLAGLTYQTTASSTSPAGAYPITAYAAAPPPGFTVNIVQGTLTIIDSSPQTAPSQVTSTSPLLPLVPAAPAPIVGSLLQPSNSLGAFQITLSARDSGSVIGVNKNFTASLGEVDPQQIPLFQALVFGVFGDSRTTTYSAGARPR